MNWVQGSRFKVQGWFEFGGVSVFMLCTLMMGGCMSSKGKVMTEEEFGVFTAEMLGSDASCEANADGMYRLCQSPLSIMDQVPSIKFFTFDVEAGKITYEGEVAGGPVAWSDTYMVTVRQSVGMIQRDAGSGNNALLIDARTGERQ